MKERGTHPSPFQSPPDLLRSASPRGRTSCFLPIVGLAVFAFLKGSPTVRAAWRLFPGLSAGVGGRSRPLARPPLCPPFYCGWALKGLPSGGSQHSSSCLLSTCSCWVNLRLSACLGAFWKTATIAVPKGSHQLLLSPGTMSSGPSTSLAVTAIFIFTKVTVLGVCDVPL